MVSKSEQKRIDALKGDDTAPIALLLKRLRGQRVDSETADPEGLMLVAADEIERLAGVNQLSIQGCRWQHIDDARELAALRARVAELEAMNKMLCGKLDDQRRALWDPCQPYLKDGETPAECIARNRRDVDIALSSLARDRARVAELEVIATSICAGNCLPPFPCAQDGCPKRTARPSPSAGAVPK